MNPLSIDTTLSMVGTLATIFDVVTLTAIEVRCEPGSVPSSGGDRVAAICHSRAVPRQLEWRELLFRIQSPFRQRRTDAGDRGIIRSSGGQCNRSGNC